MVGIWYMATAPQYQRQGSGHALLTHVIAGAIERGADTFYLGATAAGYPLYERLGFRTVGTPSIWLLAP
jgi:ribosomal protein S18 acetylase RimI-like enzyme